MQKYQFLLVKICVYFRNVLVHFPKTVIIHELSRRVIRSSYERNLGHQFFLREPNVICAHFQVAIYWYSSGQEFNILK